MKTNTNTKIKTRFYVNLFWTTALAIVAGYIGYLRLINWLPFPNYEGSVLASTLNVVWIYGGPILSAILFVVALTENYMGKYLFNKLYNKLIK